MLVCLGWVVCTAVKSDKSQFENGITTYVEETNTNMAYSAEITTENATNIIKDEDLMLLAKLIDCEAGDECSDEHKMFVGQVVLNRIISDKFPDTLNEVIYQKNPIQYISAYNGQIESNIPSERSVEAARKLLNGTRICSEDVVWQSEFPQGEIVAVFETSYSTTYFCKY